MDDNACYGCGGPASPEYGLPLHAGWIVPNDWPFDWGVAPACPDCYAQQERLLRPTSLLAFRAAALRWKDGKGYGEDYAR